MHRENKVRHSSDTKTPLFKELTKKKGDAAWHTRVKTREALFLARL